MQRTVVGKAGVGVELGRMFLAGAVEPLESFCPFAESGVNECDRVARDILPPRFIDQFAEDSSRVICSPHFRVSDRKPAARGTSLFLCLFVNRGRRWPIAFRAVRFCQGGLKIDVIRVNLESLTGCDRVIEST